MQGTAVRYPDNRIKQNSLSIWTSGRRTCDHQAVTTLARLPPCVPPSASDPPPLDLPMQPIFLTTCRQNDRLPQETSANRLVVRPPIALPPEHSYNHEVATTLARLPPRVSACRPAISRR